MIPGDPWCWICKRSYADVEGDLHCGRDGSPIFPRDEVRRAKECGSFLSPADADEGDGAHGGTKPWRARVSGGRARCGS